ncbi:MAG: hypothetical protein H7256_05300 [Bdellovibrio sp.]|nr:hypothetical protein [Bdellovibrio sp.]
MLLKIKILFILISILLVQNSEAQLRCSDLFVGDKYTYAKVIDSINSENNKNIFNNDFDKILNPDLTDKNLWQELKLRKQAFFLGRKLKELKDAGEWNQYEFDNFSKKLSKLSYLTDLNVLKTMSKNEQIIYLQARHSALSEGLENYFFKNTSTPITVRKKIYHWMMVPFQAVWWRWVFAPAVMPKLHGRVLSAEDASALLWEGPQKRADLVDKYSLNFKDMPASFYLNIFSTAQGKHYFNSASTLYNYGILAVALGAMPIYGYLAFTEVKATGTTQAVTMLSPTLKSSEEAARVNYSQLAADKDLQNTIELVQLKLKRELTPEEINRIKARQAKKLENNLN